MSLFRKKEKQEPWYYAIISDLVKENVYMVDKQMMLVLGICDWAKPADFFEKRRLRFWAPEHRSSAVVPFMHAVTRLQKNMQDWYFESGVGWYNHDAEELWHMCNRTLEQLTKLSYSLLPKGENDDT